jgi:hypothetical protein
MKKKVTHPNFYLGLVSFLLFFSGIALRANSYSQGDYVISASFALGAVHWVWSLFDVFRHYRTAGPENRKVIWIILVVALPAVGSMLFYLLGSRVRM